jgi:transcriptional regulator with XRE-family HTH domain
MVLDGKKIRADYAGMAIRKKGGRSDADEGRPAMSEAEGAARSEFAAEVGRRLRLLREAAGLNQTEMARVLDINQSNWSRFESGERLPEPYKLREIVTRFRVSYDYIYHGVLIGVHPELAMELAERCPALVERTNSIRRDRGTALH